MPHEPLDTCWTLLRAASQGDARARSAFSRDYAVVVRGFLEARWRGRVIAGELDDAAQEVFLECLKPGGVLDRADPARGEFRGLLFGVTRNVARRFEERALEQGRLRPEESGWCERVASDDPGQATLFDRGWARSLVRRSGRLHRERALADGRAGRRRIELLERRFGNDEAIRTIAADWGVPAQEVHNAYRKARTEFYGCLREIVALHSPAGADLESECRRLLVVLGGSR
jgi:DNA-directed RNA polymerase specialized sigma24 family protein